MDNIRRLAAATQFGSRLLSLETQQQLVETQSELNIDRSKMASLDAAIEGLDQKLAGADAEIKNGFGTLGAFGKNQVGPAS